MSTHAPDASELRGVTWRKSSRSGSGGGVCVEVGAVWRKSSYSGHGRVEFAERPVAAAARVVADQDVEVPELGRDRVDELLRRVGLGKIAPGVGDPSFGYQLFRDTGEYSVEIVSAPRLFGVVRSVVVQEDRGAVSRQPPRDRVSDTPATADPGHQRSPAAQWNRVA